jgi:hypothetical protein
MWDFLLLDDGALSSLKLLPFFLKVDLLGFSLLSFNSLVLKVDLLSLNEELLPVVFIGYSLLSMSHSEELTDTELFEVNEISSFCSAIASYVY